MNLYLVTHPERGAAAVLSASTAGRAVDLAWESWAALGLPEDADLEVEILPFQPFTERIILTTRRTA